MPTSTPPTDHQSEHILERLRASLAGRYELDREIGRGGMATVYLARDLRHPRQVAVKVLPPELATAIAAERFLFEIRTAAQLLHPHILGLIDSGNADGLLYYIMPHVPGESLRDKLSREHTLSLEEATRITREIASALAHAHAHGVVHRDIKPENVLLVDGTHAMITDFGLARAVMQSGGPRLTLSRHVVGTVHYMSPEQAGSGGDIDGRSDIYSLGCVLFEMLAGQPPFDADNDLAVLARHLREPPPRLRDARPDVPEAIERLVERALQKAPADRQQHADEFLRELDRAVSGEPQPRRGWFPRRRTPRRTRALAALAAVLGVTALVVMSSFGAPIRERVASAWATPLDTTRLAILPFRRPAGGDAGELAPELMLRDAFTRWRGIGVVEQLQVMDAVAQSDTVHFGDAERRDIARRFGAGRYVWGDVTRMGDSLRLHAGLYDVRTGKLLDERSMQVGRTGVAEDVPYRRLADGFLFRGAAPTGRTENDPGTSSYAARSAFLRGQLAMQKWDLAAADSAFANAITQDENYAVAYLWLAQVRGWTSDNPQQWRALASSAVLRRAQLPEREQKLAAALLHMASGQFPAACRLYDELRRTDPHDFAATFGLGECVRRDEVVVPDTRSPSGWRFRGSRFQAIKAYRDAFEMLPSIHMAFRARAFERMRTFLMTSATTRVEGHALAPDTTQFRAAPSWQGDSLVLIPYPRRLEITAPERTISTTTETAVDRQRAMFQDIAASWRGAFPDDVVPLEAMAVALELRGDSTALDTLRQARRRAADDDQRIRLAVQEVWLRVKFGLPEDLTALTAARVLADSLLQRSVRQPSASDTLLAGLALLTGRVSLAAQLARRTAEPLLPWDAIPTRTISSARALLAFASAGGPADSLRAIEPRIAAEVRSTIAGNQQAAVLVTLLGQSAGLAFPVVRFSSLPSLTGRGNPILDAQYALARADSVGARRILSERKRLRALRRPADRTLDITYSAAWTLAAMGDRSEAMEWLGPVLDASQMYPPQVINRLANAGALMRAMILRAQLAQAGGDTATARRWAQPVVLLWSDADSFLRPAVEAMHTMAGSRSGFSPPRH
jgi:tetratricopeptide (TPR) repeat protein